MHGTGPIEYLVMFFTSGNHCDYQVDGFTVEGGQVVGDDLLLMVVELLAVQNENTLGIHKYFQFIPFQVKHVLHNG